MSEYMSFERMQAIAKEVDAYFSKSGNVWDVFIDGASSEDYTDVNVVGTDGGLIYTNIKNVSSGLIQKDTDSGTFIHYRKIHYDYSGWKGISAGRFYITEAQIKKGLAILQARERKPIFVGTKQVSAIYVKSNNTVKTAKPYIKTNGQIKAL